MSRELRCLLVLLTAFCAWGCSDDEFDGSNTLPTVQLIAAPPEGSTTTYRVHLSWTGSDPDGEVVYYEYIVTDNQNGVFDPADTVSTPDDYKWTPIAVNDTILVFSADEVADSTELDDEDIGPYDFIRSHTFLIRAVDDRGGRSEKPAYRSFTAKTLSPVVDITRPSPGYVRPVAPIARFIWIATDPAKLGAVEEPESVRWILVNRLDFANDWDRAIAYIRDNPDAPEWGEWHPYDAPDGSGTTWLSPPLDDGSYVFAIQARDEAGAVTPVFDVDHNLRRVYVAHSPGGPLLTVHNRYLGAFRTGGGVGKPPVIADMPAGLPIQFEWEADAELYGQVVTHYRWAWDPGDLDGDWAPWYPFRGQRGRSAPIAFFFGTHTFVVEVRDESGFKSQMEIRVNIVPFTMENDLLLVDDWAEEAGCFAATNGHEPCDAEHDAFWFDMLGSVDGFNEHTNVIEVGPSRPLPIQVLARYKNVVWSAAGHASGRSSSYLDEVISFRSDLWPGAEFTPDILGMYMAVGGHVLLAGNQIMTLVIGDDYSDLKLPQYPMILRYELVGDQDGVYGPPNEVGERGVGDLSFAYDDACLNVLDQSYLEDPRQLRADGACPVDHLRDNDVEGDGLRAAIPTPGATIEGFPALALRPEVAGPGRFYEVRGLTAGIYNPRYFADMTPCEAVTELRPPPDCFQPIYGNGCANAASVLYAAPVAYWNGRYADVTPEVAGGVDARSVVFGFHPVYFRPDQIKDALEVIFHDEWRLSRRATGAD